MITTNIAVTKQGYANVVINNVLLAIWEKQPPEHDEHCGTTIMQCMFSCCCPHNVYWLWHTIHMNS